MGLPCPVTAVLDRPEYPSIENNEEVFDGVRKASGERIDIQFASMPRPSYGDRWIGAASLVDILHTNGKSKAGAMRNTNRLAKDDEIAIEVVINILLFLSFVGNIHNG